MISVREAARIVGCSEQYVRNACNSGRLASRMVNHPANNQLCYSVDPLSLSKFKLEFSTASQEPEYMPTEDEIREACLEIQSTWDIATEHHRRGIHYTMRDGVQDVRV